MTMSKAEYADFQKFVAGESQNTFIGEPTGPEKPDDTYAEFKHRGYVRGRNCASWIDRPEIGSEVRFPDDLRPQHIEDEEHADAYIEAAAFASEEADRSFSPFEFIAKEFNDRNDAEDVWGAFNDGIAEGIRDEVKARRAALDARTPTHTMTKSYAPQVIADNSGKFCGNALRFATPEEAQRSADALMQRWLLVRETRVVETDDPVNYQNIDGRDVPVQP